MKCLISSAENAIAKNGKPFLKLSALTEEKKNVTLFVWQDIDKFVSNMEKFRVFDISADFEAQFPEVTSFKGLENEPFDQFVEFIYPSEDYADALLTRLIDQIKEPVLLDVVNKIFEDKEVRHKFITYPGAKGYHHAFKYGLFNHSYEALLFVSAICKSEYFGPSLNKQIALTGALLHDIGKVDEYTFDGIAGIDYARELYLATHCSTGAEKVAVAFEKCKEVKEYSKEDSEKVEAVKHIIRSHHLNQEWGAACKQPVTLEAYLVFLADYYSAAFYKGTHVEFKEELDNLGFTDKKEPFVKFW